ncbi:hypothetical protein BR93DRAFT_536699 [Coniochaeta sp. PMI_546]|nr:hypothetical protein BR93DRAFT_536699 [Coniochaeta sp. PMI_546]
MPRASSSAKRTQGPASNRDTRHENGLVGPGKRITKQKSQSQLEASPKPATNNATAPPLPSLPSSTSNGYARHDELALDNKALEGLRRGSLGTSSVSSSADSMTSPQGQLYQEESGHRRIDVNDAKNNNVHRDPGPLDMAFTVLRSCPLHDTLAILIILMQVSPVALTTIYMLFTFLTFVPPVTTSSGLSITEIFDGNQGTPSLTTLLCMDVIMLGIWLFLWAPMQQFITDLAQVVISLTLGGGGSSRQGTANNIFLCVGIVGVSQWTRHMRLNSLSPIKRLLGSSRFFSSDPGDALEFTSSIFEKKGPYGWIRSILAIHILTQGLVRYIREWYLRREKRDLAAQSQLDPEAGKTSSQPGESSTEGGFGTAELDASLHPGTGPVSSKKRRKQSAQVRIRQPLWAALASTKIVMVKEYELSHAASESAGSNATDIHNLGNAPFNTQPGQIWICYVGCDEVCFNTSYFPDPTETNAEAEDSMSGIDKTKPFYVRVNHAVWQPTRIMPVERCEEEKSLGTTWTGDIYGLTPSSNYECEFVSTQTGDVIFSTSVRTLQAKSKDIEITSKVANSQRSHARHDSPATTLRASIAAADAKLAEEKARLKAARKDHNRKLNAARKEIERLTSAVQSAGGNDDKLRQKVAQNNIQQKQAEQSISELEEELKEFDTVPEDLLNRYRAKQTAFRTEKEKYDGAKASFKSYKLSIDTEIKAGEEEKATLQAKRNKIATRIAKVDNEHARITDANARGLDEAERRRQEREALVAEVARTELAMNERLKATRAINLEKQLQLQNMAAQMQAYLSSFQDEVSYDRTNQSGAHGAGYQPMHWMSPTTASQYPPQSMWPPAASMTAPAPAPSLFPTSQFPSPYTNHLQAHNMITTPHKSRGRSSSMLSDVSGFTQSTNDDDQPGSDNNTATVVLSNHPRGHFGQHGTPASTLRGPPGFNFARAHHHRGDGSASASGSGSGSGSGSALGSEGSSVRSDNGSGSLQDPTSPI